MHGHVVGLVALDQILWFVLRGADYVGLKLHGRGNLFLDRSPDTACFRIPLDMISNFECVFPWHDLIFQGRHLLKTALVTFCIIETGAQQGFGQIAGERGTTHARAKANDLVTGLRQRLRQFFLQGKARVVRGDSDARQLGSPSLRHTSTASASVL